MNSKSKTIASFGIIAALIIVAFAIETAITAGLFVSIAAISLAILLIICQTNDLKTTLFAASTFGFVSFILSFIFPSLVSPLFMNPLISIVPRICVGLTTYFSLKLFKKLFGKFRNNAAKTVPYILSGIIGIVTNTGLVVPLMLAFDFINVAPFVATIMLLNFLPEVLTGAIIVPIASRTLLRVRRNADTKDKTIEKEENEQDINTQQDDI